MAAEPTPAASEEAPSEALPEAQPELPVTEQASTEALQIAIQEHSYTKDLRLFRLQQS